MPVDNYSTDTSTAASSWTLFVAAMTSDQALRTNLISRVHNRASHNTTGGVFPVLYDSTSGLIDQGGASPAQGAMYAALALKAPVLPITVAPATTGTSSRSKSHTSAVAGGIVAAGAAFLAIGAMALVARRRRRRRRARESIGSSFQTVITAPNCPSPMRVTPFNPTVIGVTEPDTGSHTNSQRWRTDPVEPESISLAHVSSSTPSDSPVAIPVSFPRVVSVPVGLSSKELARLRNDSSRSQPSDQLPANPTFAATTESGAASSSSEAQRLQAEVEYLRQQLRAERPEPPPCYEDGGA